MGCAEYGVKSRFFRSKLLLAALLVLNAHFIVAPGVHAATAAATRSLAEGRVLPEYETAYLRESIFGGVNVLLAVAAAAVGIGRTGGTAKTEAAARRRERTCEGPSVRISCDRTTASCPRCP
jgi:F0F1-type ATP synthase membrane subunit c/vacuolar-type H+-ATPase subunit K